MSRMVRRFEVLLPLRFNDGTAVPDEVVAETLVELEQRLGPSPARRRRSEGGGGTRVRATVMT